MTLRKRLAGWLDPEREYERVGIRLGGPFDYRVAHELTRIATVLEHIDRDTHQRRRKIVVCRHPELHPEDAVNLQPTDC